MMLLNYLKVAGRSFVKQRLYSVLNVAGLAIGLTCSLLILLYIADEFSYDRQHPDADRIYQFSQTFTALDEPIYLGASSPQVGPLLKDAFPEIEDFTRLRRWTRVFTGPDGIPRDELMHFADASVFEFFAFTWLAGNPESALDEPNTIVLSRSLARKFFGETDALGQSLAMEVEPRVQLRVTGIVEDLPHNMHFRTDAFVSMNTMVGLSAQESMNSMPGLHALDDWNNANFETYLKLAPAANYAALEGEFKAHVLQTMPEPQRANWDFSGIALPDIHLFSPALPGEAEGRNLANVMTLGVIAVILLLIAAINFVNLAAARAMQRSKEVAVRKVMGSSRLQLFAQFMGESFLTVLVAFLFALVFVEIALPSLNAFTGKDMRIGTLLMTPPVALVLPVVMAMISLLAACYPALYLSALRPTDPAVKGGAGAALSLRNLLVVFQFSMTIVLVVATLVVNSQVQFARTIELGFSKDQVVIMKAPLSGESRFAALKNELLADPGVAAVTASSSRPFEVFVSEHDVRFEGGAQATTLTKIDVDFDFFETYQVPVLAGRTFAEEYGADRLVGPTDDKPNGTAGFVVNRAAAQRLGWSPSEAVGKWLERDYSDDFSRTLRGPVVGVVEDMRFDSLRDAIKPTFFVLAPGAAGVTDISVRLGGARLPETLSHIDAVWQRIYPGQPVNRSFLDVDFQAMYEQEARFIQLLGTFAGFSILISCMGLFGLTAFAAERRTREIGVRKVLGSSVWRIVLLFTNEVSRLVLLANVLAWPVAYVAMERWLENFAYRIDLTPLIFIGSGLIALCIAWVTVGGTAAKAASAKPVLALRYE